MLPNKPLQPTADAKDCSLRSLYGTRLQLNGRRSAGRCVGRVLRRSFRWLYNWYEDRYLALVSPSMYGMV